MDSFKFKIGDIVVPSELQLPFWEYRSILHDIPDIMFIKFKIVDISTLPKNKVNKENYLLIIESINNDFTITSNNNKYNSCFFKLDIQYIRERNIKNLLNKF